MSPLPTEVPEPTTVALGQEDKGFPGCCVSQFSRNPPLLSSRGKHLPLSLRRDLPRLALCQDIWNAVLGNIVVSSAAPRGSTLTSRVVCLDFHHRPGEQLPASLRGLPPGRGRLQPLADNSPGVQPHCTDIILLGKSQFATAQPVPTSLACPLILWHSQYLERQQAPFVETFFPICFSR